MFDIYTITTFLSLVSFAFVMLITPGPNNIFLLSSGLNFGYKKTIPTILGVMFGFSIMIVFVGLGLGVVIQTYPYILDIIKFVGILYLFYLAYKIAISTTDIKDTTHSNKPFTFVQIVVFQWINPKAWIMSITTLSIYINDINNSTKEVITIAIVYLVVSLISTNIWALGGVFLQNILKNKKHLKLFNILMAILIVSSVFPILY
jgi:threonine/homoserine/homoserine lactone efflux protein